MFGLHPDSRIGKAEVIEFLALTEAADMDADIHTGIGDGIVRQVAENGIK